MESIGIISTLELMPTTENEANNFAFGFLNELNDGNINPLTWAKKLKQIKNAIEIIENGTKEFRGLKYLSLEEASKDKHNEYFEIRNKITYDYSLCGHNVWNELENNKREIIKQQKDIEKYLRTIKGSITTLVDDEIITHYEPQKISTEYLIFKK